MIKIKEINCPICKTKHEVHLVESLEKAMYQGVPIEYTGIFYECSNRGTIFQDEMTMYENISRMTQAYKAKMEKLEIVKNSDEHPYMVLISPDNFDDKMITISEEEFKEHIEDENFFEVYGNPVKVTGPSGTIFAVSFETYRRHAIKTGKADEIASVMKEIDQRNNKDTAENTE